MRREWSGIIKNRQWGEFESLAKTEPCQDLADTVAELERGLPEKADRRALRKVLYILSQAGYEPQEIEEREPEGKDDAKPLEVGHLASADPSGTTLVLYGAEREGRVRCLVASLRKGAGIMDAFDKALPKEEARDFGRQLFRSLGVGLSEVAIPPEYALSRIGEALREQKGRVPMSVAYWRAALDAAPILPHPTTAFDAPAATPEERRAVSYSLDAALGWHLEMGSVMPMLEEIQTSQESGVVLTPEQRRERYEAIFTKGRAALFTPELIADHALRLRDLAYIFNAKEPDTARQALSAALDFEERGPESDYARGLLEKTIALIVEGLKEADNGRQPIMRRFS
jgi:hypothetical protein